MLDWMGKDIRNLFLRLMIPYLKGFMLVYLFDDTELPWR